MATYWLLKGELSAPGWDTLRKAYDDEEIEIVHLDPKVWAMVQADDPPKTFEGLVAIEPVDAVYLDPQGNPLYMVGGQVVTTAEEVIASLGEEAEEMLENVGDAHTVLQRLGRAF